MPNGDSDPREYLEGRETWCWAPGVGIPGVTLVLVGFALHLIARLPWAKETPGEGWDVMAYRLASAGLGLVLWGSGALCSVIGIIPRNGRAWGLVGASLAAVTALTACLIPE